MKLRIRVRAKGAELSCRTFDGASVMIGRGVDCDVRLDDVSVSRHHARIDRRGPGYLLRDLASSNGTIVDSRTIELWPLKSGDSVCIAGFTLDVELLREEATTTSAEVPRTNPSVQTFDRPTGFRRKGLP